MPTLLPLITRTKGAGKTRPRCSAKVHQAKDETLTRTIRRERHARRGIPEDQCGSDAVYIFNGRPLCRAHAGAVALAVLLDIQERAQRGLQGKNDNDPT